MIEAETLLDCYFQMKCPCCRSSIVPVTIGRVSYCLNCGYTWNVTCIMDKVEEKPELRDFHRSVFRDYLREVIDDKSRIQQMEFGFG